MRQFRIGVGTLAVTSFFITLLLYYWQRILQKETLNYITPFISINDGKQGSTQKSIVDLDEDTFDVEGTPMMHIPLDQVYKDKNKDYEPSEEEKEDAQLMLLKTPGCQIPLPLSFFQANSEKQKRTETCGKRAVYLKKVNGDTVKAKIKEKIVMSYLRKSALFECCYRFILKSNQRGQENKKIRFTPCKKFYDGEIITLESDFINVKCSEVKRNNVSHEVYDDVYAFTKMINVTDRPKKVCKQKYNILLLGMDSMSMLRFVNLMEKTKKFMDENSWIAFRALHKVGDNTLPNLMAALTGQNFTSFTEKCAGKMETCHDLFIWNKFRDAGYVTAYGEDFIKLPDTFHDEFALAHTPTDHYLKPLFMKGEQVINKSLVCAGKRPSGQHLLDYALDFAVTYRSQQFFGMFWMNSYSHNINSRPEDADSMIENFLNRLSYTGVLEDTFIVFFSDHGIRFGEKRMLVESYYNDRLPFLFIWSPTLFIGIQTHLYNTMAMNQNKLVTHYDLYNTFVDIHRISACEGFKDTLDIRASEGCPNCHSLFRPVNPNRTCADAAIHEKWCSCHKMYRLDVEDAEVSTSVKLILSHIKNISEHAPTTKCFRCMKLALKNVVRVHFYNDDKKINLYHVIALSMTPGNISYEATVRRNREAAELVGPISIISPYRGKGNCVIRHKDRVYCICERIKQCSFH